MVFLETIIYASILLASGMFAAAIGYYIQFLDKIKAALKIKEDAIMEDMPKSVTEMVENLANVPMTPFPKDRMFEGYTKMMKKQFEIVERRELVREPITWSKNMIKGICLAILLFLASGILGLTQYDAYMLPTLMIGMVSVVYSIYKFYQIVDRIT